MVRLRIWFNGVMKRYLLKIMVIFYWCGSDEAWEKFNFNIYTTIATRPKPKFTEITAAELLEELHKHAELNPYRDDLIGHLNAFIKDRS